MSTQSPLNSTPDSHPETLSGLAISLGFWFCLLVSASLFAAVSLSPKFLSYLQLRSQYDTNQLHLVTLERQAGQLQRVIDAIRDDKEFASELTRIEFDVVRPDEEVIPVDKSLKLDAISATKPVAVSPLNDPWYEPLVRHLASDVNSRIWLLSGAAALIVISFTLLQPAGRVQVSPSFRGRDSLWRSLRNRYVRRVG